MKNIIKIIVLFICATGLLTSCDKDSEGLSKIVSYPVLSLEGSNFIVALVNTPFDDPGAIAFAGDESLQVTTTGSVDVSIPGYYTIIYSASVETEIGPMSSSIERKVIVVSQPLTEDYSIGTYVQTTNASRIRTVSKPAGVLGWYRFSDSNWQSAGPIPVEFIDLGSSLKVIPGSSIFGPHDGTVTYNSSAQELTFNMTITSGGNAGYTWSSTWKKQ
jgi:hypothetical protein